MGRNERGYGLHVRQVGQFCGERGLDVTVWLAINTSRALTILVRR